MAKVTQTRLPGVGVRHEFVTEEGERVAVVTHRSGRREIVRYRKDDPDVAQGVLHLGVEDARTLSELLGASQVSDAVAAVQYQLEGLAIDWITLPDEATVHGTTIADGAYRTRTGSSIVAIVRGDDTIAAPEPHHELCSGDIVVAVGRTDGLRRLREVLLG